MTSNAKIGLLIGLIVVFLVVFTVNGLSVFDKKDNNSSANVVYKLPVDEPDQITKVIPNSSVIGQRSQSDSHRKVEASKLVQQSKTAPVNKPDETNNQVNPAKQTWPKYHIVRKGENLGEIAKKFYGPKEGNRIVNIKKIFEANSKSLISPDKIYPGQKLIIPSLWASAPSQNNIDDIFPESMFEKVDSIGRKHI